MNKAIIILNLVLLSACGGGGGGGGSTPTAQATASISASTKSVMQGDSIVISWTSSNASSCTASGYWSGSKVTSDSETVLMTGDGDQTLTIACGSESASVTVQVKTSFNKLFLLFIFEYIIQSNRVFILSLPAVIEQSRAGLSLPDFAAWRPRRSCNPGP